MRTKIADTKEVCHVMVDVSGQLLDIVRDLEGRIILIDNLLDARKDEEIADDEALRLIAKVIRDGMYQHTLFG